LRIDYADFGYVPGGGDHDPQDYVALRLVSSRGRRAFPDHLLHYELAGNFLRNAHALWLGLLLRGNWIAG
jgi:hypothetical protein